MWERCRLALIVTLGGCTASLSAADEQPRSEEPGPVAASLDARVEVPSPRSDAAVSIDAPLPTDAAIATARPDAGPAPDVAPSAVFDPTSPTLPVLWFEVGKKPIVHETKTPGTLKVILQHEDAQLAAVTNRPIALQVPITIDLHGATSLGLPNKSYGLDLLDDTGQDRKIPFLGMPAGADWVLHGCGQDRSCVRNALAYALARDSGRYAPRTAFAELYIDGEYKGFTVVVEKIRLDKNRVALPKSAADGDISGAYIFKQDLGQGTPGDPVPRDWVSKQLPMVYSYAQPRFDDMTPAQRTYLQGFVDRFEAMTKGPGFLDPTTGYRGWIDLPSWVDFALMQELSNNIDAYQKSFYWQKWPKEMGDKLALGPIWDFDYAFGVAGFRDGQRTDIWAWKMNRFGGEPVPYNPPGQVPHVLPYWEKLWQDPGFTGELACRWKRLRTQALTMANVDARLDAWTKQLARVAPREQKRWPGYMAPTEMPKLRAWIDARLRWMDANLPGTCAAAQP